jgi:predicted acyltransferase
MNSVEKSGTVSKDSRWLWLDSFRGLAVIGMTFVNACIYLHDVRNASAPSLLLHSTWSGFTVADAVFPAFIFAVGISASVSLPEQPAQRRPVLVKIALRSLRLFLLGLLVSNLDLIFHEPDATFRVMGVLQRIGLVYAAVGVFIVYASGRVRILAAALLLSAYAMVLLLPAPDVGLDLTKPGIDLPAWTDRSLLPGMLYVNGPFGFDPEGLLSTIPAVAQGLIGVAFGMELKKGITRVRILAMSGVAIAMVALGATLSGVEPICKSIWTPTFVLLSSGVSMLVAIAMVVVEKSILGRASSSAFSLIGRNAIVAYVLQEVFCDLLKWAPIGWGGGLSLNPGLVTIADAALFTTLMAIPVLLMARSGRNIRI